MANVPEFTNFLKSRSTGLKQKSADWVCARKYTIGASEVSALTGKSPFETPRTLLKKKVQPPPMHNNVACTWGSLFEPIARKYFEKKHSVSVFGHSLSLNLAENDPLFEKVTCSPDGYGLNSNNELVLLEFKCPFKRDIAKNCIPSYYRDQIQTGLALSGDSVNKGLFVDNQFRICSFEQIESSSLHNPTINGGKVYRAKGGSALAWGICYLYSKQKLSPKQKNIIDLGSAKYSKLFGKVMASVAEKEIVCVYGAVITIFTKEDENMEFSNLCEMRKLFANKGKATHFPVAVFAWKLLNTSEIWEPKQPNFLESIRNPVECFHKNLRKLKNTINDFVYEDEEHENLTVIENRGDDKECLEAFLENAMESYDENEY